MAAESAPFERFLARQIPAQQLASAPHWAGTARLLNAVGALTFGADSLADVAAMARIHQSLLVEWYAEYYTHPFWAELLEGRASKAQLRRWVLRTYYLSRSVGMSAAAGALHSGDPLVRRTFFENALEEYDHCRVHYGLADGPLATLGAGRAGAGQLPVSRMIDDHFLAIAECDQWGHALSALYQEQTIMFRDDVLAVYDSLESRYGLEGLFHGWRSHVGVDETCDHAGAFAAIFAQSRPINPLATAIALTHAWASASLITLSLDEIAGRAAKPAAEQTTPGDLGYVLWRLRFIFLKAMSRSRSEDAVVALGDLLAAAEKALARNGFDPESWTIGLRVIVLLNRLQSHADRPADFRRALHRAAASDSLGRPLAALSEALDERSAAWVKPSGGRPPPPALPNRETSLRQLLGQ